MPVVRLTECHFGSLQLEVLRRHFLIIFDPENVGKEIQIFHRSREEAARVESHAPLRQAFSRDRSPRRLEAIRAVETRRSHHTPARLRTQRHRDLEVSHRGARTR